MESSADQLRAFALSVLFHLGLLALVWLGMKFTLPKEVLQASGEPVQATLDMSAVDLTRIRKRIDAAIAKSDPTPSRPAPTPPKPPQPIDEPKPQTSDTPEQMKPQAPRDHPDEDDQEKIAELADLQAEQRRAQEEKRRQDQVDLTRDIQRQEVAERRQRLRAKAEEIQRELEAARRQRKLEEQKLQQLADLRNAVPAPRPPAAAPGPTGQKGPDDDLRARYMAAMQQVAEQNWNHVGAPARVKCKVRFRQIRGGGVIKVEFIDCPYDNQGREFVDRALNKQPMPYAGFEKVFEPDIVLTFCYPNEECAR